MPEQQAKIPVALTIAGSDPSGGAGLQADLKTFHQAGVYGMSVVTLVTVQNTVSVAKVRVLEPELVVEQLRAVLADIRPQAAKTGALGNAAAVEAVADCARDFTFPLIVDPVMISKHGASLLDKEACEAMKKRLLPAAFLVTPNLEEAKVLSGIPYAGRHSLKEMAASIAALGAARVLIKGGHAEGEAVDYLYAEGKEYFLPGPRIPTRHTHGTGCTFSAAVTAGLAKGYGLPEAARQAKLYISKAIETHPGLGRGMGPVNHFAEFPEGKQFSSRMPGSPMIKQFEETGERHEQEKNPDD